MMGIKMGILLDKDGTKMRFNWINMGLGLDLMVI
jgi:hypothetical protein